MFRSPALPPAPPVLPLAALSLRHARFFFPPNPPEAVKRPTRLNANPLIQKMSDQSDVKPKFCCFRGSRTDGCAVAALRTGALLGFSHLWSNSASTQSRLIRVSEERGRASVFKMWGGHQLMFKQAFSLEFKIQNSTFIC